MPTATYGNRVQAGQIAQWGLKHFSDNGLIMVDVVNWLTGLEEIEKGI